ncbi:hypothetical protein J2S43_004774 [Catenuloplanes nepalensis]|uniref:Glycosyltransferase RgtA/B/C/D-like domain-containing protein n=1 Tax=Catenuloplanes nepalensis TaxID=587533 RepID=A0ABT9MXV3_9ACTN|nr:hypothetical protein [Catenuloplanes nepalensis]MDP9796262.1 hypothetical protein [Catenuloplanes nepalensis]
MTAAILKSPVVREISLAVGAAVALTAIWLLILPHVRSSGGDALHYLRLAENPRAQVHTPYTYRMLMPLLANEIGGRYHYREAYRLLNAIALASGGVAAYLLTRKLGGTRGAAYVAMAGLLSLPGWLFYLYQPYLIDPAAMALLAWSMLAALSGWTAVLPLLLVAAALARETVISFAVPLYMIFREKWVDWRAAIRVALVVGPGVLATTAVQAKPTHGWPSQELLVQAGVRIVGMKLAEQGIVAALGIAVGTSLGVWWALGLYGFRHAGPLGWLMVPVLAQFVVGGDWGRFCLYAFPALVPAGAIALWRHPRRAILIGLVVVQSLLVFVDLAIDGHPKINSFQPSTYASLALIPVTFAVLLLPSRRARTPVAATGTPVVATGTSIPAQAGRSQGEHPEAGAAPVGTGPAGEADDADPGTGDAPDRATTEGRPVVPRPGDPGTGPRREAGQS